MKYGDFKRGMAVTHYTLGDGVIIDKHNQRQELLVRFDASGAQGWYPVTEFDRKQVSVFDQIHPMLAKDLDSYKTKTLEELLDDPDWGMEEKFDGERQILAFFPGQTWREVDGGELAASTADLGFRATTRVVGKNTGRLATNSTTLHHAGFSRLPVSEEGVTVFDVELLHPDGFQTLRSIMGSSPDKAKQRMEELGPIHMVIFDVLWFGGRDLRGVAFEKRRKVLDAWRQDVTHGGGENPLAGELGARIRISRMATLREGKEALMKDVAEKGGEGVMLKRMLGTYTDTTLPGRRSADLLKVKPFTETDVILTGFQKGQGMYNTHKFSTFSFAQYVPEDKMTPDMRKNLVGDIAGKQVKGWMGSPVDQSSYFLVEMGTASIKDTEMSDAVEADPDSFIGRVMEVQFQQRWPDSGRLRHGGMRRWRDDKSPEQCIYEP